MKKALVENRNMWGSMLAETFEPVLEFDFIGPDGFDVLQRVKADVDAMSPGDRLELRAKQVNKAGGYGMSGIQLQGCYAHNV